jgi:hypothetical protein
MLETDAIRRATLSVLDVVEELAAGAAAGIVPERAWTDVVAEVFAEHRRELQESLPDRLVRACGGDQDAARRVLHVLDKSAPAGRRPARPERPSEAAMREAFPVRQRVRIVGDEEA